MVIAGLQKLSLVDFPGHLCSVVFVQGCNFRCGYCQNPDLIPPKQKTDWSEKDILDYLSRRKSAIEGVVITGGEPIIYDDLPAFAKKIKDSGFKVKVDTNGSDPARIERLLKEKVVDYISLDIKTSFPKYSLVTDISNIEELISGSIRIIMGAGIPYEFRTTCVPGIVDEKDFVEIGKAVKGAERYCLQQFRPQITFDPDFQKVTPYTKDVLEKFRDILTGFVQHVELRGS